MPGSKGGPFASSARALSRASGCSGTRITRRLMERLSSECRRTVRLSANSEMMPGCATPAILRDVAPRRATTSVGRPLEAFARDARQLRTRDVVVGDRSLLRWPGAVGAFEHEGSRTELELAVPNGSGTFLPRDCVARLHRHRFGGNDEPPHRGAARTKPAENPHVWVSRATVAVREENGPRCAKSRRPEGPQDLTRSPSHTRSRASRGEVTRRFRRLRSVP